MFNRRYDSLHLANPVRNGSLCVVTLPASVERSVEKRRENARFGDFLVDKLPASFLAFPLDSNQRGLVGVLACTPQAFPQAFFRSNVSLAGFPQLEPSAVSPTQSWHCSLSRIRRRSTLGRCQKVLAVRSCHSRHPLGLTALPHPRPSPIASLTAVKTLRYSSCACPAKRVSEWSQPLLPCGTPSSRR
jgi:hypothetical protein